MKIEICYLKFPSSYEGVKELKNFIGSSSVKAFSLDENNELIEGEGYIASDDLYNYHNNYDSSDDCMWFNKKKQWFYQDIAKVKDIQRMNNKIILEKLQPFIDKANENL